MDIAQHLQKAQVRLDQRLRIGRKIIIVPTDIDDHSVRYVVRGEKVGGAEDGGSVHEGGELAVGSRLEIGSQISVILMGTKQPGTKNSTAIFGVTCPHQFVVYVE